MLEVLGCVAILVVTIFVLFVVMALEAKLKAQAAFFNAEARRSQSDAAYVRFLREQRGSHPTQRYGRVGGLPESMLPREFQSSFPKV